MQISHEHPSAQQWKRSVEINAPRQQLAIKMSFKNSGARIFHRIVTRRRVSSNKRYNQCSARREFKIKIKPKELAD